VRRDIDEAKASLHNTPSGNSSTKTGDGAINVTDSGQLLLLLKGATPAPGQKVIVAPDNSGKSILPANKSPADLVKPKTPQPLASPIGPPDNR
jgi:hypothetical protein